MIRLAWPWLLLLWPLPFCIWALPPMSNGLTLAIRVPFFSGLYSQLGQQKLNDKSPQQLFFWLLIWTLLLLAAAGPKWVGEARPMQRDGRNIMLAMDLSPSMEINDMAIQGRPVNRLTVVKIAAQQFVQKRLGDRIGLILFGSRAYLQTPLTYDRQTVLMQLKDATIGLAGRTTAIGDAIGLAIKRLKDVPENGRVLILLTDGANNAGIFDPITAAKMAKKEHIKVYTIGLGAAATANINQFFIGPGPSADLDESTLKTIAKLTDGQYFRATNPAALQRIYDTINRIETISQDQATVRPEVDYYPWLLGLALFLISGWFFKDRILSMRIRLSTFARRVYE